MVAAFRNGAMGGSGSRAKLALPKVIVCVVGLALIGGAVGAAISLHIEADPPDLVQPLRQLPPGAIELDTQDGQQLLFESDARASFTSLMSHFMTQVTQTYCGVASISMVLNALKVPSPISQDHGIHRLFTQTNLLNEMTDPITTQRKVARNGMSLRTLAELLEAYGVEAVGYRANSSSLDEFRERAVDFLGRAGHHVIVNYSRLALGQ